MAYIAPVIVPYSGGIPGGIHQGLEIEIQGTVLHHAYQGFSINLCQTPQMNPTTTLHFNVRFNENCVVRNHMHNNGWGTEERHGGMPFKKGQGFDLRIKVKPQMFKISVNGQHFADFSHRLPKETAQYLVIQGEVSINFIRFTGKGAHHNDPAMAGAFPGTPYPMGGGFAPAGSVPGGYETNSYPMGAVPPPAGAVGFGGGISQPIYNPPVPFKTGIPGGMYPGRMINISGMPQAYCSRFTINLQSGMHDGSDIVFHFDARINFGSDRNVIVRNHCKNGSWGQEERQAAYFPFMPNASFDILILAEAGSFKVAVNNQHFVEFRHRLPLQSASVLSISGDVGLTQVRFQ